MEPISQPFNKQISSSYALDHVRELLQGSQSTEEKAKALLALQQSNPSPESDDEDDSSLAQDPWDEFTEQEDDEYRFTVLMDAYSTSTAAYGTSTAGKNIQLMEPVKSSIQNTCGNIREYIRNSIRHMFRRDKPRKTRVEFNPAATSITEPKLIEREPFMSSPPEPVTTSRIEPVTASRIDPVTAPQPEPATATWPEPVMTYRPPSVKAWQPKPVTENRYETCVKKALFQETLIVTTTLREPKWNDPSIHLPFRPLFSGWNVNLHEYMLQPQGRFVAETKKAFNDFLERVEIGGEVQVFGTGGGLSSTGLPALLKRSFTSYEWLGMWRSSEGRRIRVSKAIWSTSAWDETPSLDEPGKLSEHEDELQILENEVLGLDKYRGGHSEYMTVITYSDDWVGAISLFKAELSSDHQITQLDRVATIPNVPREICSILREEIKPNRYVVGRSNRKLKCYARGNLPPMQIVKVSNQECPWASCGGGWRKAFRVPNLNSEYSSGEGLVATIPHLIGLLHLQHLTLTNLDSSPAVVFDTPLNANGCQLRRGVLLKETPKGSPHIGGNTRITVLFPRDSNWAQEQFVWA